MQLETAIPQDRYIKITSMNIGDSAVADRDFGGLVFTYGKGWAPKSGISPVFDPDNLVVVHTAAQALNYFASDSDEYKFAVRYFSYLTPTGDTPRTLNFARMKVTSGESVLTWVTAPGETEAQWCVGTEGAGGSWNFEPLDGDPTYETPAEALARVGACTNNFGSFCFIDDDLVTCGQLKEVALINKGLNYRYLLSGAGYGTATTVASDSATIGSVSAKALATYLGGIKGTAFAKGDSKYSSEMPMALFAATDYEGINTAPNHMYKKFDAETPTVVTEAEADELDDLFVNYVGRVQANGAYRAFYQRGHNLDGEDTAVYCNEIWLKSAISTAILDYQLTVNRIPANSAGEAIIYSIVETIAAQGVSNGTIEKGKTLDNSDRLKVTQTTNVSTAWENVERDGSYLSVNIVKDKDRNEYKAVYRLVYAKGDSVKFIEGFDYLV